MANFGGVQHWLNTVATGDTQAVTNLYLPHAVLVATFEKRPLQGHRQILDYMNMFIGGKPGLSGQILEQIVQAPAPGICVVSGIYEFSWPEPYGGSKITKKQKARFTYVFEKTSKGWAIVTHHSSVLPE